MCCLWRRRWTTLTVFDFPGDAAVLVVFPLLLGSSGQRKGSWQEARMTPKQVNASWDGFTRPWCSKSELKLTVCSTGCRPYSIAPCEHHVNGTRPPCQGEQETPKCEERCADGYLPSYQKDKHYGTDLWNYFSVKSYSVSTFDLLLSVSSGDHTYSVPSQQEQIMTELYKNGPVEAAFSVYADFLLYKTGEAGRTLLL